MKTQHALFQTVTLTIRPHQVWVLKIIDGLLSEALPKWRANFAHQSSVQAEISWWSKKSYQKGEAPPSRRIQFGPQLMKVWLF